MPTADDYRIRAIMTSHRIPDMMRSHDRPTLTEIARVLDLSRPTVHKHFIMLETAGYVMWRNREYEIGLELVSFGTHARRRRRICEVARSRVVGLVSTIQGQVCLVVSGRGSEWNCLYIFTVVPTGIDTSDQEGGIQPLHAMTAGKVLPANMDENEVAGFLDHNSLSSKAANMITERSELQFKLRVIRDQEVACDGQRQLDNYRSVVAPVLDDDGCPLGAIEVLGPPPRISGKCLGGDTVGLVISRTKDVENKISIGWWIFY